MNRKNLLKRIVVRTVSLLVLAGLSASAICYALGYFELPYITRPESGGDETTIDLGPIESSIKGLESGENVSGIGADTTNVIQTPESSTDDAGSVVTGEDTAATSSEGSETAGEPYNPGLRSTAELLNEGYKTTYASWNSDMLLASLEVGTAVNSSFLSGNTKQVLTRRRMRYEDGGIEFVSLATETQDRRSVELYMGYIIVDTGIGSATVPFIRETGSSAVSKRETVNGVQTLTVFNTDGKLIGTFPADYISPAYTRDTSDRALFLYKDNYYYLDEKNACLVLSDYDDERDNRGLYFDYNPNYGKSDCNLKKYSNYEEISLNYVIDTYYHYARFAIDWRIAKELYVLDPDYAEIVAKQISYGKYYNRPFSEKLRFAKIELQLEAANTTTDTTPVTEPVTDPADSSAIESSAINSSAVDSSAVNSSALDSSAISSSAVDSSAVNTGDQQGETGSSARDSSSIDSSSVSSSAVDSSAVDSSSIDSSAIDSSATDSSAIETAAEETTAEPEVTTSEKDTHKILDVTKKYNAYRFIFATKQPAVNNEYNSIRESQNSVYLSQTITWKSQYKYAKAFNFSENRAVTFDDNGRMKVINTNAYTVFELKKNYLNDAFKEYVTQYYIEPFYRDASQLGHYYYDEGLLRARFVEIVTYNPQVYITDYDVLLDTYGNRYEIPSGFTLYAYSEGVLILQKDGLYGCYHKDGYWIAQPVYSHAEPFVEGLCVLSLSDGTCGMIDKNGTVILPFRFSSITNASSGVIAAYTRDGGWYVFTKMSK